MSDEMILDELLDRWEEASEEGQQISAEELCRDYPELLPVLRQRIAKLMWLDGKLQQWDLVNANSQHETVVAGELPSSTLRLDTELTEITFHKKGGLGVVFRAQDARLHRPVALKLIQRRLMHDAVSRQRFSLEAEITGRLAHPGIVTVYGIGETDDGRPYYAMPLLEGDTFQTAIERLHELDEATDERQVEFRKLLQHFVSVCHTVAFAHRRKVVHRDIKPDNIMLGRFGETYLLDWGLACVAEQRAIDDTSVEQSLVPVTDRIASDSDQGVGTPAYMSPEQTRGDELIRPESDIYSLGVTLYKLLTGSTPFEGDTLLEVRRRVIEGDFPRPCQQRRDVPAAMEAICLKAMARHPGRRYHNASVLANEIETYLADGRVEAYDEPLSHKLSRWGRRHRTVMRTAAVGLLLLLLLITAFSIWMLNTANRERWARQQGLQGRARLAATLLAHEIDRRWWELESASRDRELIDALQKLSGDSPTPDANDTINRWIARVAGNSMRQTSAYAWFVVQDNGRGTQIARHPFWQEEDTGKAYESLGRSYAHRDYFHGQGPAPPDVPIEEIRPIRAPHLAAPFASTNDGTLLLAFSVPIWPAEQQAGDPLGVIGMAVALGDLTRIDHELAAGQSLALVNLKADRLDGQQVRRGLIMHHSGLTRVAKYTPHWIDDSTLLTRLEAVPAHNRQQLLLGEYHDPMQQVSPSLSGPWMAACSHVVVRARGGEQAETGWMVVLQERP